MRNLPAALLEEMEGSDNPVVFVQDYHFALCRGSSKSRRVQTCV